jgi:hypothetical protein
VQQRAGLVDGRTIADAFGLLRRPGLGLEAGYHLRDPNRQGELMRCSGFETYFDLNE